LVGVVAKRNGKYSVVEYFEILTAQAQVIPRSPSYSEFPLGQDEFPKTAMPMRTRNVMKGLRMTRAKMTRKFLKERGSESCEALRQCAKVDDALGRWHTVVL
jgi:hypothetical protein